MSLLDDVATFPRRESIVWVGRVSYLAALAFVGMFILRLLSPLQWLKKIVRTNQRRRSVSGPQSRTDFHAGWTEAYFLMVLVTLAALNYSTQFVSPSLFRIFGPVVDGLRWIFLVEILVWVAYYGGMRSFIERQYSIYHRAEYVLAAPLAFTIVVTAYSGIAGVAWQDAASLFLGIGDTEKFSGSARVLGTLVYILLFTVVLSYLLAQFPRVQIKGEEADPRRTRLSVVGAGDVVISRIVPAALASGLQTAELFVMSLAVLDRERARQLRLDIRPYPTSSAGNLDVATAAEILIQRQAPILIATPTMAHLPLVEALHDAAERFGSRPRLILEKPLVGPGESAAFSRLVQSYGEGRVFSLGYYYLEKALPLTYCWTGRSEVIRYLRFHMQGVAAVEREANTVRNLVNSLGSMTGIVGRIIEGAGRSPSDVRRRWILDSAQGALAYEMLVHLLMLADEGLRSNGMSGVSEFTDVEWALGPCTAEDGRTTEIGLKAAVILEGLSISIDLKVAKFADQDDRQLVVTYEHGSIRCDFERREAHIFIDDRGPVCRVSIQEDFELRYSIQLDLVRRFIADGFWPWNRTDGLDVQLSVLRWLDEQWPRLRREYSLVKAQSPSNGQ